jgi:hypothetical protein
MPDQKISQLPDLAPVQSGDIVPVVRGGSNGRAALGTAASRNVGTSAGTVAAGDDSRINGAAQKSANLSDVNSVPSARANLASGFVVNNANTTILLSAADNGTCIRCTANTLVTITAPNDAAVNFNVMVIQAGTGQVQFQAASGATIVNRQGHTKTAGQHACVLLLVTANSGGSAANYNLSGDTAA